MMPLLGRLTAKSLPRRARKEARSLAAEVRAMVESHAYRVSEEARREIAETCAALERACAAEDHDAVCRGLARLEEQRATHLSFASKSTAREYVESIAVAVLIALFLRAFVVEAFKIPSGSMIPTMEVGDHIFVNKFIYGVRIPFTKIRFFDWRKPRRGEVIVFIYPREPEKDFIKRVVGIEGDQIEVRNNAVILNGRAIERELVPGPCEYWDYEDTLHTWSKDKKRCTRFREKLGDETFVSINELGLYPRDFPGPGDPSPYVVPKGHVFVMGDNRNNSHDSRFWGPVPVENIKGKAMVIWWSSAPDNGPDGIRWERLGHVVD